MFVLLPSLFSLATVVPFCAHRAVAETREEQKDNTSRLSKEVKMPSSTLTCYISLIARSVQTVVSPGNMNMWSFRWNQFVRSFRIWQWWVFSISNAAPDIRSKGAMILSISKAFSIHSGTWRDTKFVSNKSLPDWPSIVVPAVFFQISEILQNRRTKLGRDIRST